MAALLVAAQEYAPAWIAIGGHEAQALNVELFCGLQVFDEEHDMTYFDRLGTLIDRTGRILSRLMRPGVHLSAIQLDVALLSNLKTQRDADRINAGHARYVFTETRDIGKLFAQTLKNLVGPHAPNHFP